MCCYGNEKNNDFNNFFPHFSYYFSHFFIIISIHYKRKNYEKKNNQSNQSNNSSNRLTGKTSSTALYTKHISNYYYMENDLISNNCQPEYYTMLKIGWRKT